MIQKLTGMVLHKQPYDDNSAIITILSQELGKLAFLHPGYKKLHQKISMQYNSWQQVNLKYFYHIIIIS